MVRANTRDDIARMAEMGFSHVAIAPAQSDGANELRAWRKACEAEKLSLLLEMDLTDFDSDHPLVRDHPECFSFSPDSNSSFIDPRLPNLLEGRAVANPRHNPEPFVAWWAERLGAFSAAGAKGFCFGDPQKLPGDIWRDLLQRLRRRDPSLVLIADTSRQSHDSLRDVAPAGFDFTLSSLPWWNGRAPWLVEQHAAAASLAPAIALVEAPRREPPASCEIRRARLAAAAVTGAGVMMPFGYESGHCEGERAELAPCVKAMNALVSAHGGHGWLRSLTGPGDPVTMILRSSEAELTAQSALIAVFNPHPTLNANFDERFSAALGEWSVLEPIQPFGGPEKLGPGEARLFRAERPKPIVIASRTPASAVRVAAEEGRVWIGNVAPSVDNGAYPSKAATGQNVTVEADLVADGHGQLAAELQYRADDERTWRHAPMRPVGNDRWQATMRLTRVGQYRFAIEAWPDQYGTYVHDLAKKRVAKVDTPLDAEEGRKLIETARERASKSARVAVNAILTAYASVPESDRPQLLLSPEAVTAMRRADPRDRKSLSPLYCIESERRAAQFGSWYELFPRSQSTVPGRHGTFEDVIGRIPAIAAMGFDVLYLTPIHPIGRTNRKGRNNSLAAAEGDPGSTYAIGSAEGGHTAIHPELGSLEDFRKLVQAAHHAGMEIALDFAVQCSPDHPWLKEHPGWFDWRPDGTIKYAENPPKRYEDIVNVDFYAKDAVPELWLALRDVVLFWIQQGVRIFRVDNPHTKPFAFWQWLISDLRKLHPDTIFLSEAFTRPKIMYHLAKLGFSQSYTYFTWRNTKYELTAYINELTANPISWFFRPNFFVNTPDINPAFLQTSGRPGFIVRAALAALLAGSWGMYSGFELCESQALAGREEYSDSEKYQLKFRDWNTPGNIVREITALNRLRRSEPALQSHLGTTFYNAFNDNILYFGRYHGRGNDRILVAINLNPHHAEQADFEIPLWEWGLPDSGALVARDLLRGGTFIWHGKIQRIWLSPDAPVSIWRVRPAEVA